MLFRARLHGHVGHGAVWPVLIAASLVAGGCGTHHGAATSHTSTSTSGSPAAVLKPVLQGIVEINQVPSADALSSVGGVAVSVAWRDLQPVQGGPIVADNPLDKAIVQIRQINQSQGLSLGIRARVQAGVNAPDWAKQLGGSPVLVTSRQDNVSGTVGRFWTAPFGQAYDELQRKLAATYDDVAEVREVTVSRCTTIYSEPMIRQASDASTVANLLAAGFGDSVDDRCQHEQIDAHQVWRHTRTGLALNPYQHVSGSRTDTDATIRYLSYCRQVLGPRCVLENNSIRWPVLAGGYGRLYDAMSRSGPPMSFQTASPSRIGDVAMTLSWAADRGANGVELTPDLLALALPVLPPILGKLRANPSG